MKLTRYLVKYPEGYAGHSTYSYSRIGNAKLFIRHADAQARAKNYRLGGSEGTVIPVEINVPE